MKYGETLQKRSIPLWENCKCYKHLIGPQWQILTGHATPDNVDYNDIKRLIKVRTTYGQCEARAIPGSNNEAKQLQAFEDELYCELREQHQRIDLFVQSKSGEIARRLAHLDKQIAQLRIRAFAPGQTKLPIRRLEKFSKAEAATLKVGEEIQCLSRFVGVQSLAFQKLLKKYKKWTGSATLGKRFRETVLDRPISFSKRNFQSLLAQWTEVLVSVRAPFDEVTRDGLPQAKNKSPKPDSSNWKISQPKAMLNSTQPSHPASQLHAMCEYGSGVDVDTALATTPMGLEASRAVYWIHSDNLVQIHVLLLQYTRLQRSSKPNTPLGTPPNPRSSPRGSLGAKSNETCNRKDEEVGTIILDDLQQFAKRQNSETVCDSEDRPGTVSEKAAASIRYSSNDEAVVVAAGTTSDDKSYHSRSEKEPVTQLARMDREAATMLFKARQAHQRDSNAGSKESEQVRDWLANSQHFQPLVQLQARRTRFVGLLNGKNSGIWVTLDRDIVMRSISRNVLVDGKWFSHIDGNAETSSNTFPHAVLEVRIEGSKDNDLIAHLNASHLLPALGQDIRKIPAAAEKTNGRASNGRIRSEPPSTNHSSISASSTSNERPKSGFSIGEGESSMTSAPDTVTPAESKPVKKGRRQSHRRRILQKGLRETPRSKQQRYWNEFDDGSEGSEDEAYTILVDPNASAGLPGAAVVSNLFARIGSTIRTQGQKVAFWRPASDEPSKDPKGANEPLLNGQHSPGMDDSDLSDEESSTGLMDPALQRRYSTFPNTYESPAIRARETLLFRSCVTSFLASLILLFVAAILETTGRRKAEATVDAGVIIGVAASLVFAIIAVGSMVGRKDDVGWVHRTIVVLVFACVVACSGTLLAALE
ncbi:hypothetical protein ACLMJK_007285 [Lecanora helva]